MDKFTLSGLRRLAKEGKSPYGWIRYRTPTTRVSLNDDTKMITVESRDMKTGDWVFVEEYEGK